MEQNTPAGDLEDPPNTSVSSGFISRYNLHFSDDYMVGCLGDYNHWGLYSYCNRHPCFQTVYRDLNPD